MLKTITPYSEFTRPHRIAHKQIRSLSLILSLSLSVLMSACGPSETQYVNVDTGWTMVGATNDNPTRLSLIHEPDNVVKQNDLYASANSTSLSSRVTKIVEFDTALYMLMPEQQQIEVISRNSYKRIATISTAPHTVVDLCFANSTTAYTANDDSTVSIIDATIYRLLPGRDIVVGERPVAIAALGNQLCVALQSSQVGVIISTSLNSITKTFSLVSEPRFVGADKTTGEFSIVCGGADSPNSAPGKSPAQLMHYNTQNGQARAGMILTNTATDERSVSVQSFFIVSGGFAYLGLNSDLVLVDTRNSSSLGAIAFGSFSAMSANSKRAELVCVDNSNSNTRLVVVDYQNSRFLREVTLPIRINHGYLP